MSCMIQNTFRDLEQVRLKACKASGQKHTEWVEHLHGNLQLEFDQMRKAGVRFLLSTLGILALQVLEVSTDEIHGKGLTDTKSGMCKVDKIESAGCSHL